MNFQTGGSEAMRINASQQVGIGTASPSNALHIKNSNPTIRLEDSDGSSSIYGQIISNAAGDVNLSADTGNAGSSTKITFSTDGSEAMRITSGGDVLVAKTSADISTVGIELDNVGRIGATRSGNVTGLFNRLSSDGDVVRFQKDGTTVGVIGTQYWGIGASSSSPYNLFVKDNSGTSTIRAESSDNYRIDIQATSGTGTIRTVGSYPLILNTNQTERMRILSGGNVGIGTSSPSQLLHVNGHIVGNSLNIPSNTSSPPSGVTIHKPADNTMAFRIDSTEEMRLTSTGLGIGNTAPSVLLSVGDDDDGSQGVVGKKALISQTLATVYAGGTSGSWGGLMLNNNDSTSNRTATGLHFTHGTSGVAGLVSTSATSQRADLRFITRGAGDTVAERMRIGDDGDVGIGTTSPARKLQVADGFIGASESSSNISSDQYNEFADNSSNWYNTKFANWASSPASQYMIEVGFRNSSPDNSAAKFFQMLDNTTTRVNINSDGDLQNHDNSYGGISDERIKQDIVDASSQWEDIKNIRIRKYKKKHDVIQYGEENAPIELGVISDWFLFCDTSMRIAPPLVISEKEIRTACQLVIQAVDERA